MKVNTTKSKNAESFYIRQSYVNSEGKSTSKTIRKLGTLNELLVEHGPTRDDVMRWAKKQAEIETEKYKAQKDVKTVLIPLRADKRSITTWKNVFKVDTYFCNPSTIAWD